MPPELRIYREDDEGCGDSLSRAPHPDPPPAKPGGGDGLFPPPGFAGGESGWGVGSELFDFDLCVNALRMPRFEAALQPAIREGRLLDNSPWTRTRPPWRRLTPTPTR